MDKGEYLWEEDVKGKDEGEDARSMIQDSLASIWNCLRVFALFVLWKLCCRYVFDNYVLSLFLL